MARQCKCAITGEIGDTDNFVKINNKYYKNQEIYDKTQAEKILHKEIVNYICYEFLNYKKGQKFNTILIRKLNELKFYSNEIILATIKNQDENIKKAIRQKDFNSEFNKIAYIFGIINNNINQMYEDSKKIKKQETQSKKSNSIDTDIDMVKIGNNAHENKKDISKFLEGDEI